MNINGFRRWLKAQIASFDDDTDIAVDRADETVPVIHEAKKIAIELTLPDVAALRHGNDDHAGPARGATGAV